MVGQQSIEQMHDFVFGRIYKFVRGHREPIIENVRRGDYEDIPVYQPFETFYWGELGPKIEAMMRASGYSKEEIDELIGYHAIYFYRETVPNICNGRTKRYDPEQKKELLEYVFGKDT